MGNNFCKRFNFSWVGSPAWILAAAIFWLCWIAGGSVLASEAGAPIWIGPDGEPLPFASYEAAEAYLESARVIEKERIGRGINNPWKVLLEADGIQAHAVFRDVDVSKQRARFRNGKEALHFRDCALFEIAAYRLSRLLHLDGVPPTVERRLDGHKGSLQLWIEKAVSEKGRMAEELAPKDLRLWRLQMQHLRFFDNLISNSDRNQGNILFDQAGRIWMIDHTRAFRRHRKLESPRSFYQMERRVWERLAEADRAEWEKQLSPYLHWEELRGLWKRREEVVNRFQQLIADRGEKLVLLESIDFSAKRLFASR